jgi:hypothetical protein
VNHTTDRAPVAPLFYLSPNVAFMMFADELPADVPLVATTMERGGILCFLLVFNAELPSDYRAQVVRDFDMLSPELAEAVADEITRADGAQADDEGAGL